MKIKKTVKAAARRPTANTTNGDFVNVPGGSVLDAVTDSGIRQSGSPPSHLNGGIVQLPSMRDPHTARALKAWKTRRSAWYRAGRTERASKAALADWCITHGWKVVFFEGKSGAPRTGVVDAVLVRIAPGRADSIELRLVQLKAGAGGLTASEVKRLKAAASEVATSWVLAAFDGNELHFVPDVASSNNRSAPLGRRKRHGA